MTKADENVDNLIAQEFIQKENIDDVRAIFDEAIKIGLDFKTRDQVINFKDFGELKKIVLGPLPLESTPISDVLKEFKEKIADNSTNFGSKNFMAFPDAGNAVASVAASFLLNLLNQNLINSKHCSPAATLAEINVIQWMRELLGYDVIADPTDIFDIGGAIVSGGVMANTVGMMLARERAFPGTKEQGVTFDPRHVKVIIPDYVNHYSIKASLGWLGIGEEAVLTIKSDNFKMNTSDLKQKVNDYSKDNKIMAAVCYAGDSRSMTIDNFKSIHDIIKEKNIWFHVDACHGGQLAFSDKLRNKIKDIELADSITMDPHKVLFTPYAMSIILAKNPSDFKTIAGSSDLITKEDFAFGQITPMLGSRNFSSLKLWFLLKTLGRKNIGKLIDKRHYLAQYLAKQLEANGNFVVLNKDVNINSVVFLYVPKIYSGQVYGNESVIEKVGFFNKTLQDAIFRKGMFYVHTFSIPDLSNILGCGEIMTFPLRYMGGNPLTCERDIDKLIKHIAEVANELEQEDHKSKSACKLS